ncbi:hypothetical protein DERF_014947 [Dermatophagoides farinae]|uniref:Uncharacterized protein n=1 Tax=Dermatophagoides farinae TaxID=6954 RepID=A0A922KZR7_DERFA|nr:hypothetical protein DERF_014947 [Dermatophagoides farinae]
MIIIIIIIIITREKINDSHIKKGLANIKENSITNTCSILKKVSFLITIFVVVVVNDNQIHYNCVVVVVGLKQMKKRINIYIWSNTNCEIQNYTLANNKSIDYNNNNKKRNDDD